MKKRMIWILLAAALVLSLLPIGTAAEGGTTLLRSMSSPTDAEVVEDGGRPMTAPTDAGVFEDGGRAVLSPTEEKESAELAEDGGCPGAEPADTAGTGGGGLQGMSGTGTYEDPYQITSYAELKEFAAMVKICASTASSIRTTSTPRALFPPSTGAVRSATASPIC